MGLNPKAKAQRKIAILGVPSHKGTPDGIQVDIDVQPLSMGVLHRTVRTKVGLCLGVAAGTKGTIAQRLVAEAHSKAPASEQGLEPGFVRLRHPGGVVDVGA